MVGMSNYNHLLPSLSLTSIRSLGKYFMGIKILAGLPVFIDNANLGQIKQTIGNLLLKNQRQAKPFMKVAHYRRQRLIA
jgi:hypothetical protein